MKQMLVLLSVSMVVTACDSISNLPLFNRADFVMNLSTTSVDVAAGDSVTLQGSIERLGNYVGTPSVSVSVEAVDYPGLHLKARNTILEPAMAPLAELSIDSGTLAQGPYRVRVQATDGTLSKVATVYVKIPQGSQSALQRLNAIRTANGLSTVTEDLELSADCWLHGRYQVMNDFVGHVEDPAKPFYSAGGARCAGMANVGAAYGNTPLPDTQIVDIFMNIPFHTLGLLRPGLKQVGLGMYRVQADSYVKHGLGAGLISDYVGDYTGYFPANNSTTDFFKVGYEWPNPVKGCGYDQEAGAPLIVSTPAGHDTTATEASFTSEGKPLEVCAYGSTQFVDPVSAPGQYPGGIQTATGIGRAILKGSGAVVLIPKEALLPNKQYTAGVTVNGQRHTWSFRTSATPSLTLNSLSTPRALNLAYPQL